MSDMTSARLRSLALGLVCSAAIATTPAMAQDEALTFTGWLGLFNITQPVIERLETDFESASPGVDFQRNDVPFEQTVQQAQSAHLAGTMTDIVQMMAVHVPALAAAGALEPLNDLFTEEELAAIPETTRNAVTNDGKMYSMPWITAPILLFYNRNLLAEAGWDPDAPPQTWPELKEAMLAVCALPEKETGKVYGMALRSDRFANSAQWTIPFIYGHGGDIIDADGNPKFNTPETVAAYSFIQDLVAEDCAPTGLSIAETRNLMGEGRAAFIFEGPWGKGMLLNLSGDNLRTAPDGDLWVTTMPRDPSGNTRTIGNPHQLAITAASEKKELAAELIRFATTNRDFVQFYYEATDFLTSGNKNLLTSGAMGDDEYIQVFVDALGGTYDNPIFHPQFNSMLDELVEGYQKILAGADVATELEAVDRRVQRIMRR